MGRYLLNRRSFSEAIMILVWIASFSILDRNSCVYE
jgi:hypothetical protein